MVAVNGESIPTTDVADMQNVRSLEAIDNPLIVRIEKVAETSWTKFAGNVPVEVSLLRRGRHETNFRIGDPVELQVELSDGYQFGDYLDVCLPDSLSRVFGGGQVKQFAVDFEGESTVNVPLVTTGASFSSNGDAAPHHFSILIRNMYDEERIACPAFLRVNVIEVEPATFHMS
jgi:hypothetical protein